MEHAPTIVLRTVSKDFVDLIREATGQATGSKAFIDAANRYLEQTAQIERLVSESKYLESENKRLLGLLQQKQVMFRRLAPLCIQVAEIAGQGELFE